MFRPPPGFFTLRQVDVAASPTIEAVPQILTNSVAPEGIRTHAVICPWDAPLPLRLWHLASFDAPTVAVVWALGFAWAAGVQLPAWFLVLLALVAWTVYIADRLLDARAGARAEIRIGTTHRLQERHHFHWRNRRIFVPLAVAAVCAAAWIVLAFMPPIARERNTLLAAAALAYFARVHSNNEPLGPPSVSQLLSPLLSKEFLVAVLFTTACALPTFSRLPAAAMHWPTYWPLTVTATFFVLLAWLNCYAIDYWESTVARQSRENAIHLKGRGFSPYIVIAKSEKALAPEGRAPQVSVLALPFSAASLLALLGLILAASLAGFHPRSAALLAAGAASALLLALLDRLRNHLTPVTLRAAADFVLLTPALVAPLVLFSR
jgi:hypothetical protein